MPQKLHVLGAAALTLLGGLTAHSARAQTLRQGFEGTSAETWSFTVTPATYNFPSLTDIWAAVPSIGTTSGTTSVQALPAAGTTLWGMQDLQNPATTDLLIWHFLDFAPVALQSGTTAANTVSFKYFTNGFEAADSLAYVVQYDNGTSWPATKTYVQLSKDTRAYQTVTVAIPASSTHVRLRLAAKQNGNDDWAAWDEVELTRSAAPVVPSIRLATGSAVVNENAGTVTIPVSIQNPGATASTVEVALTPGLGTATAGSDFTLASPRTLTFPANATADQSLVIPITDDGLAEGAEYFSLKLQNPTNATLTTGATEFLVYIKDNDGTAPVQSRSFNLSLLGSYQSGAAGTNSAEIVAHDPTTQHLYVANSVGGKLDILSLAANGTLTPVGAINILPYGNINSVAVRNGIVACAIENTNPQLNGSVVLFDQNGTFLKQVTVGALPDMVTFSPDGRLILTANEGEPKTDYSIDPEGSVSIIDFSAGVDGLTQASVTTVGFNGYNGQAAQLRADGIRIYGGTATTPSTVAQDLEPEYVAISADSRTAYITLQENNALATLDLSTKQFTSLRSLGYQDHSQPGFSLDASDQTPDVLLANWPIRGMRQPDALATFEVAGQRYLLTANEGDAREYTALTEAVRLGDATYPLDATAFPQVALLKNTQVLGRLNVTNKLGDTDGDGDFDQIYAFGGRSFSILNATTGALVHDSGDLLERLTSTDATFGAIFNASNSTGVPVRKNRSDDKGPEPEGVTTAVLRDTVYAFVSLERIGGVAVFNVNDPAQPRLVQYINNRSTTAGTGDQGPEGIVVVSAANSPTRQPLVILANEVSSTVAVYGIQLRGTVVTGTAAVQATAVPLFAYPNPTTSGKVRLSRPVSGTLADVLGRPVRTLSRATELETAGLAPGLYVVRAEDGATTKLLVR
ncbi:choice-of-anchor I family protein [Hymenobacter chitinivorans]|uniref:Calx-beta domain-containing protein n=1 Tax=Hymenobacter chitinivorans DSM 11115 TaxID=1121954 RepID=A0A2M9BRY0_9BACT|nr:choice-of-anchor I family protein [Hymenobacter chitinivorans]PJJ60652.1 Calx-beta domain-containing protein [Hymenobacter chitinivorans DSM 11115]